MNKTDVRQLARIPSCPGVLTVSFQDRRSRTEPPVRVGFRTQNGSQIGAAKGKETCHLWHTHLSSVSRVLLLLWYRYIDGRHGYFGTRLKSDTNEGDSALQTLLLLLPLLLSETWLLSGSYMDTTPPSPVESGLRCPRRGNE